MLRSSAGAELPAPASFSRPFLDDGTIILREAKDGVPTWLWTAAIAFIFSIYAVFIGSIALGLARLTRRGHSGGDAGPREPGPAEPPRATPAITA